MSVKTNTRENAFFRQIMNLRNNFNKNLQSCQPMQYFTWFLVFQIPNERQLSCLSRKILLKSLQNRF